MRNLVIALTVIILAGCSALMVSGGNPGNNPYRNDERPASQATTDATLVASVRQRLASDTRVGMYDLGVSASNGRVTLSGSVDTYAARERAEQLAIGTAGVSAVDNRISVQATN